MSTLDRDAAVQARMNGVALEAIRWQAENAAMGGVCDFCASPLAGGPVATYVTDEIEATLSVIDGDLGTGTIENPLDAFWAACPRCEPVIDRGDVAEMVENAISNANAERLGFTVTADPQTVSDLTALYEAFVAGGPTKVAR